MTDAIFSNCFIDSAFKRALVTLWAETVIRLNPDTDLLLIDSAGPVPAMEVLVVFGFSEAVDAPRRIVRVETPADHPFAGWRRDFLLGMRFALMREPRFIAFIESDVIFTVPVAPIFRRMTAHNMGVAMPFDPMYQFFETGLAFYEGAVARANLDRLGQALDAADWPKEMVSEIALERVLGPLLHPLALRGCRDDINRLTVANLHQCYPWGLDYLTHCPDLAVYRKMLALNGSVA